MHYLLISLVKKKKLNNRQTHKCFDNLDMLEKYNGTVSRII
jgi:hypothetical protein